MKKLLFSSVLAFSICAQAQTQKTVLSAPTEPTASHKKISYQERANKKQLFNKTATTASAWFNQVDFLEYITPGTMSLGFMPVFPDSSIILGFATGNVAVYPSIHKAANYIDPSFMLQQSVITNKAAVYTLDSLYFGYGYERRSNVNDSIIIEVIAENQSLNYTLTGPPAFPYQDIEYNYTTDKLKPSITVLKRIGYQLLPTDTAAGYKQLGFAVSGIPAITGSKKIGTVISYKPGYTWTINDTLYNGHTTNVFWVVSAEGNGDGGGNGTDPTIFGTPSDYTTNMNMSYILTQDVRYNMSTSGWNGYLLPTFAFTTPFAYETHDIGYKLTCTNVGIEELESKGHLLGQNVPNPFSGNTAIAYELAKDASNVTLTICDVTGRVISAKKGDTAKGTHNFSVESLTAGVYYYTLNVDGQTTTRKMISE